MKNLAAPAIRLHPNDNVLVARTDLAQGSVLAEENLTCLNRIPAGHKIAARAIGKGEPCSSTTPSSALPRRISRPGRWCTRTTWSFANSTATTPMRATTSR